MVAFRLFVVETRDLFAKCYIDFFHVLAFILGFFELPLEMIKFEFVACFIVLNGFFEFLLKEVDFIVKVRGLVGNKLLVHTPFLSILKLTS